MAWINPKLNWKVTDYFTFNDYSRVVGNIQYLVEYLVSQDVEVPTIGPFDLSRGIATIPYVETINVLEDSLEMLATLFGVSDLVTPVVWYPTTSEYYTRNPSYLDWLRWEQALQLFYDTISSATRAYVYSNEFYCEEV